MSRREGTVRMTPAVKRFLQMHKGDEILEKWFARKTYDFVGRVRDAGLIEIIDNEDSRVKWPWNWQGTRLTEAGKAALK